MSDQSVCVVIDYQNIHLTAHGFFMESLAIHESLIEPCRFAERVVELRARRQTAAPSAALASVRVFRGQPSNKHESFTYGISQRQRSQWTRDPRVEVTYRSLRYPSDWPDTPSREKGIDVLVGVTVLELALAGTYDVVILASHDSDLEPALEVSQQKGTCKIETAGWAGGRIPRVNGRRLWHTTLNSSDLAKVRDHRNYLPPASPAAQMTAIMQATPQTGAPKPPTGTV
ncbi:NYN domain-containing protein [Amycolatopsis japonica]